ncbi:MAG: alpha/beta fold hydrolase [Micropruina sp.]|nr:alpha/beta fold hydrolase [Micropruina sp.]
MTILPGAEPISMDGGEVGVLLCHGYPSTPQSMRGWAEHLAAAGHTVRVPLLPGMGTHWKDLNATEWQDWYGEIERAHTELAARCSTVFAGGLSMGGLLATKLAQEKPDLAGVVLVNPIFAHNSPALRVLPWLRHLVPSLGGIAGDIRKPDVVELAYDCNPLQAMYSQTKLWRIVVEDLPQLRLPVLLLTSVEDHVVPPLSWRTFLNRVGSTDVTHVVLENSYHVATLDNDAELIFDESVAFIRRVTGQA